MEQVRIGLIGGGFIGGIHALMLKQIADALGPERVALVAVADPDPGARGRIVSQCGFEHGYDDALAMLREAEINAAFICTPTRYHAEQLDAALDRHLHVFCEKPLAMSYDEAQRMVERTTAAGVYTQIGLVLRFSPVYTRMRTLVHQPVMGAPMAVVFRDDQCFPIRGVHKTTWRADRNLTAGGTMIEHGVHDVDLMTWMFGPIARLRAWEQNRAGHKGVEDYVAIEVEFASGLRAQLVNLWHNIAQRHSNRRLEIFCENGFTASEDDMLGSIILQVGEGSEERIGADAVGATFLEEIRRQDHPLSNWLTVPYLLQDLCFVEALLADRAPEPDIAAGLEAQRLVEAIYHSARTGEEVEVAAFGGGG